MYGLQQRPSFSVLRATPPTPLPPAHLATGARGPGQAQPVGQHRSSKRGAVVAAPADEHDPKPGHLPGGPEGETRGRGLHLGAGGAVSLGLQTLGNPIFSWFPGSPSPRPPGPLLTFRTLPSRLTLVVRYSYCASMASGP